MICLEIGVIGLALGDFDAEGQAEEDDLLA